MLGYDAPEADDGLLRSRPHGVRALIASRPKALALASASLLILAPLFLLSHGPAATSLSSVQPDTLSKLHGVSLGGWLVMEINPSVRGPTSALDMRPKWMFDQIEAESELDFVTKLRKEKGDAYAITTMRNHWEGYISDAALDAAQALGIDAVRIPVGYWIMDAPVHGGGSPLEYGISPEGFVTGGLNALYGMLTKLHARGIAALIDVHAMPCNSGCVSDGLSCDKPYAFFAPGAAPISDLPRCGGGTYSTTRAPRAGEVTWGDVGLNAVAALAQWIADLPPEAGSVYAYQLANEPALGPPGIYEEHVNAWYERALPAARLHLPTLPIVLSFIPPTSLVTDFLSKIAASPASLNGGAPLLADHHYYLNWQEGIDVVMGWDEIHSRACSAAYEASGLLVYTAASQQVIVGEWSLAVNHDAPLDLTDPETASQLSKLYAEQLEVFGSVPEVRAAFFWTLRMGSGWDPRPTETHPHGHQVAGTSAWVSLPGYPFLVWSLLELGHAGIATPLNQPAGNACAGVPPWVPKAPA